MTALEGCPVCCPLCKSCVTIEEGRGKEVGEKKRKKRGSKHTHVIHK